MENNTEYEIPVNEAPVYEIPILISIDASNDLDVVENLIYDIGFQVLEERDEQIYSKPLIKYRKFNESFIELYVLLKVKSLSDRHSIKKEFIRVLKKHFLKNGVTIPYPNYTDLSVIS